MDCGLPTAPCALLDGSVLDVAPTVYAMAGVPPAHDMDGRILDEAFESALRGGLDDLRKHAVPSYDAFVLQPSVPARPPVEADAEAIERLRSPGYLE